MPGPTPVRPPLLSLWHGAFVSCFGLLVIAAICTPHHPSAEGSPNPLPGADGDGDQDEASAEGNAESFDPNDYSRAGALSVHGGNYGTIWMIQMSGIQRHLNLSEDQVAEVNAIYGKFRNELNTIYGRLRGLDGTDREKMLAETRQEENELALQLNCRIMELLDQDQALRMDGLFIQSTDMQAFFFPAVIARFSITEEQKAEMQEQMQDGARRLAELSAGVREGRYGQEEYGRLVAETQREITEAYFGVLTEEQEQMLDELRGDAYPFPRMEFQGIGQ